MKERVTGIARKTVFVERVRTKSEYKWNLDLGGCLVRIVQLCGTELSLELV